MDTEVKRPRGRPKKTTEEFLNEHGLGETATESVVNFSPAPIDTETDFPELTLAKASTFFHHLYKLELSDFQKNIAIDGQEPVYEETEHVHFFHTVTSDGKEQIYSTSVGGHFHQMKITPNPKGPKHPPKVECVSGPMRLVRKKNKYGQFVKVLEPMNDVDHHTHTVAYRKSDELRPKAANIEAVKTMDNLNARGTVVPDGVIDNG